MPLFTSHPGQNVPEITRVLAPRHGGHMVQLVDGMTEGDGAPPVVSGWD